MGRIVGIDLGTTNSLVAYVDNADRPAQMYSRPIWLHALPFRR